jgi:hypothetical protein
MIQEPHLLLLNASVELPFRNNTGRALGIYVDEGCLLSRVTWSV